VFAEEDGAGTRNILERRKCPVGCAAVFAEVQRTHNATSPSSDEQESV
jgi:hypothetical protein